MKPRALSEFFVHHVDGEVGCAVGSNRHWLDTSEVYFGSATYAEDTGRVRIIRNTEGVVDTDQVGGSINLNPAVRLRNDFDVRVWYSVIRQPAPGLNNQSRFCLRASTTTGPSHNDARVSIHVAESGGITRSVQTYRYEGGWYSMPIPAGHQDTGWLRIAKTGTTVHTYVRSDTGWVEGTAVLNAAEGDWRVQLYASSTMSSWPATPPADVVVDFSEFGAY